MVAYLPARRASPGLPAPSLLQGSFLGKKMLAATSNFMHLGEREHGYCSGLRLRITGFCPQLSSQLLELGLWMSPFPVPQFHHLYQRGYNISLRICAGWVKKMLDKTKEFCNFKRVKILECFDFCVMDSKGRGSSG